MFGSAIANEREKLADSGQHEPEITDPQDDVPRRIGALRVSDVLSMVGAILASLSMTTFIFTVLAPIGGVIGFLVIAYILFLITYAALVALDEKLTIVRARVVSVAVHSLAVIVFATLVYIVAYSVFRGAEALPYLNFFIEDMSYTGPLDPVTQGGVIHAIVGSLIQIGIALAITIPLGLATAVFLSEQAGIGCEQGGTGGGGEGRGHRKTIIQAEAEYRHSGLAGALVSAAAAPATEDRFRARYAAALARARLRAPCGGARLCAWRRTARRGASTARSCQRARAARRRCGRHLQAPALALPSPLARLLRWAPCRCRRLFPRAPMRPCRSSSRGTSPTETT
jgi:hypothetical protein